MNVILTPVGSFGDVYPFVGLGQRLQARGHRVTVVVCAYFESLVRRVGLEYVELGTEDEYLEMTRNPDIWHPTRAFPHLFRAGIRPMMRRQYEIVEQLRVSGDSVAVGSALAFGTRIAREKLAIPYVSVHLQPSVLWSEHLSPELPKSILPNSLAPRWFRRMQYWIGERFFIDLTTRKDTNAFRAELGLAPMSQTTRWWHSPDLVLCMFPDWFAPPQPDWPPQVVTTSFPLWDEPGGAETSAELEAFLDAGDAPLVFTPGSAMRFGQSFFKAAVEACRRLGRRAILLSRFEEHVPSALPEGVRHFRYVPLGALLPRAAASVHHGGIGTTAQGLAAGVPQLIMPLSHDQPDNAARLKRLGVGDSLSPRAFKPRAVAARLDCLLGSAEVRESCRSVAARFQGRDGLAEAADAVERLGERSHRQSTDATLS